MPIEPTDPPPPPPPNEKPRPLAPSVIAVFPRELRASRENYPFIEFSAFIRTGPDAPTIIESVFLPMPEGISFGESGEYGTVNLGIIAAGGGADAVGKMMESPSVSTAASGLSQTGGGVLSQIKSLGAGEVGMIAGKALGVGEGALFAGKGIMSPNTNTTFTGNKTREFTFSFKLVGRIKADSNAIRSMHNFFRKYTYAEGDGTNNIILSYPPVWTIRFYANGKENEYFPKIFSCYLSSTTSVFNSSSNMFRPDGAPIEVDITLAFQETRMLTRQDIIKLEAGVSDVEKLQSDNVNSRTIDSVRGIGLSGTAQASFINVPSEVK